MSVDTVSSEFEPLDTRLADRIRTLESNKEILTEKVADLRRTAPSKAADQWREQWDANATTTSVAVKSESAPNENDSAQDGGLTISQPPRWDDVQDVWERGALGLVQLKSGLTETSGKLAEAKKVVDHIDG
jgi:kinetochor protein Mis14/NSL1